MFQSSQVSQFRSGCSINRFYCLAEKLGPTVSYFHEEKISVIVCLYILHKKPQSYVNFCSTVEVCENFVEFFADLFGVQIR